MKNIVLVHGGFVDGSGWQGVYRILKKNGYNVSVVQNPTISLEGDVAVTKRTLEAQDGPAFLSAIPKAEQSLQKRAHIPKWQGLFTSPHLHRRRANPSPH